VGGSPIYYQRDDTRLDPIVATFLALGIEVDLQARLADKRVERPCGLISCEISRRSMRSGWRWMGRRISSEPSFGESPIRP
jgi:hypothetical protein